MIFLFTVTLADLYIVSYMSALLKLFCKYQKWLYLGFHAVLAKCFSLEMFERQDEVCSWVLYRSRCITVEMASRFKVLSCMGRRYLNFLWNFTGSLSCVSGTYHVSLGILYID